MAKKKDQNFLQGAAILAATVAVLKILGAVYKIPLGNILGDEGFAHFNIAYAIYNLLLTLSTAGLPVALSRMIAAANAEGRPMQVKRIFSVARLSFFVLGSVATVVMLLFPVQLASAMDNPAAAASISALAPSVVLVCLMSAYRGYTQGLSDMTPTSVSQIIEVICKLVFGLSLAWWLLRQEAGLSLASAGAISGVTIGSVFALLYCVFYKKRMEKETFVNAAMHDVPDSRKDTLKKLIAIGIPVTLGSSILGIFNLIDAKLILNRLQDAAGFTAKQATEFYGAFSKVQTLFNLPAAFVVPITISIIPAISAAVARKSTTGANKVTETALKLTGLLALPAGAGLSVLSAPIVVLLYPGSNEAAPELLAWLGISAFFVCLTLVTNAILQAYGYERFPIYTMTAGGMIKVAITWIMVSNPDYGVLGAAVGTLGCYLAISTVNLIIIVKRVKLSLVNAFLKPIAATAIMSAAAYLFYNAAERLISSVLTSNDKAVMLMSLFVAIILAVIVYFALIIVLKVITKDDLSFVPKGDKFSKILRIR